MSFAKRLMIFFTRTDLFSYALLWLMALLIFGTIAQKYIGLYSAEAIFFNSWVIWMGGFIPLPGTPFILLFMATGLLIKTLQQHWTWRNSGSIILHGAAFLLLAGGFITATFTKEGALILPQDQEISNKRDYYEVELSIEHIQDDQAVIPIIQFSETNFKGSSSAPLKHRDIPFTIKPVQFYHNVDFSMRSDENLVTAHNNLPRKGMLSALEISSRPRSINEEENISALKFELRSTNNDDNVNGLYALIEDAPISQTIHVQGEEYQITLRHKHTKLPFSVELTDFRKITYSGTNMAKAYESDIILREGDLSWQSTISMNTPLRHRGYTLYQSSFLQDPKTGQVASVLAVTQNNARLFPYIATGLICLGLLIHLFMRIPKLTVTSSFAILIFTGLLWGQTNTAHAQTPQAQQIKPNFNLPTNSLGQWVILHNGRIKPFSSFARAMLTQFSGRDVVGRGGKEISSSQWLVELLFTPSIADKRPVFRIQNPDIEQILDLKIQKFPARLSFDEISPYIKQHIDFFNALEERPAQNLSKAQRDLQTLYRNTLLYLELRQSLSLFMPRFSISKPENLFLFGLSAPQILSAYELQPFLAKLNKEDLQSNYDTQELQNIIQELQKTQLERKTALLKIVPDVSPNQQSSWLSPWESLNSGKSNPMEALQVMTHSMLNGHKDQWKSAAKTVEKLQRESLSNTALKQLQYEHFYYQVMPLKLSLILYGLSLLFSLFCFRSRACIKIAFSCLSLGTLIHLSGIILRVLILDRPPVATFYESIIFVSFICALTALFFELRFKNNQSLFLGALLSFCLLSFGSYFGFEGDNMEVLVAVLNSNFWLSIHVITITIGYGCALIAGGMAHIFCFSIIYGSKSAPIQKYKSQTLAAILIALFFTLFGTLLGGIWADQSWGRFWGWDPKENGALLIVLWLLFIIHGHLSGFLKKDSFILLTTLTCPIVMISWFGVNLLGVGLHSYGFNDRTLIPLASYGIIQTTLLLWISIGLFYDRKT